MCHYNTNAVQKLDFWKLNHSQSTNVKHMNLYYALITMKIKDLKNKQPQGIRDAME
jgi:hypothetical protein